MPAALDLCPKKTCFSKHRSHLPLRGRGDLAPPQSPAGSHCLLQSPTWVAPVCKSRAGFLPGAGLLQVDSLGQVFKRRCLKGGYWVCCFPKPPPGLQREGMGRLDSTRVFLLCWENSPGELRGARSLPQPHTPSLLSFQPFGEV